MGVAGVGVISGGASRFLGYARNDMGGRDDIMLGWNDMAGWDDIMLRFDLGLGWC